MKRVLTFALIPLSAILFLFSCQKAPELVVTSPASIDLSADGSSGTITFTANRDWSVSASDSWVTISPSSGAASDGPVTVTVRCSANTTYDDRTATVTIRMEDLSQTITVKQPANKGVVLPKQVFDLQSGSNTIEVEVQANVQYTVSTSVDWIKQTETKGLTSKTLTFSIEENKTYDPREGKITIKPQEGNAQEQVISVKQAQKDALNVEKTSYEMPYGGGEIEIKVEANVSFDVKPNAVWIHYVETKALSNSIIRVTIDENKTFSSREGSIEITQQNGSLKHTITVNQAGRIAVTSVELDPSYFALKPGETATLVARIKPDNATDKSITWRSSDENIATVDDNGIVTAISKGRTTITAIAGDMIASCCIIVYIIDMPEAIDLGLSVKWASCNIGASEAEEYGEHFSWGEIKPKQEYSWFTYKWATGGDGYLIKYCPIEMAEYWDGPGDPDGKTSLDPEDDVAHMELGGNWRMPTIDEWTELRTQCTWTWTTLNGVYGRNVVGPNGNNIFLPTAGYWYYSSFSYYGRSGGGHYWSSSLMEGKTQSAYGLGFDSGSVFKSFGGYRYLGFSIRPVTE